MSATIPGLHNSGRLSAEPTLDRSSNMNPNAANETCGLNREENIMEIIDKAANSANEAVDKVASATHQAAEAVGKKGEQLKNAEQQLLEGCQFNCSFIVFMMK